MTIEQSKQPLAGYGTITSYDPAAMKVREAMRAWLRAFEDMHGLPRSFQTVAERNGGLEKKAGHHHRD